MKIGGYYLFEVVGKRQYRGHQPGERFVTRLDAALERAIARPNVRVISEIDPTLQEGRYGLPDDWPPRAADATHTEAPKGASFVGEGG